MFGWTPIHNPLTVSFLASILVQALWCPWDYPSIFLPTLICPELLRCCHVRDVWPCERVSTARLRLGLAASSILSEGEQAVSRAGAIQVCRSDVLARWHVSFLLTSRPLQREQELRLPEWLQPVMFLSFNFECLKSSEVLYTLTYGNFWICIMVISLFLDMNYDNTTALWNSNVQYNLFLWEYTMVIPCFWILTTVIPCVMFCKC